MAERVTTSDKVNVEHLLTGFPVQKIRDNLLQWWNHTGQRRFPWRQTRDPFKVLIAEVLLHRTRADQVVPLYQLFLERFPNIQAIAESSPDELQRTFYSAGLIWRWKLLHAMAVNLVERFNGQIPDSFEDLTSLPGVSHYIASAVRCFAFDHPDPILDTNTVRVAGRLLGLTITDSSRRSALFRAILQYLVDPEHPREFNFALIDFAAAMCKSRSPIHQECPLRRYCRFYLRTTSTPYISEDICQHTGVFVI